jgi:glutaredoxin 3
MITIITKGHCPYCHMAIGILEKLNIEYTNIDITSDNTLYEEVKNISGSQTVPQVFIGDIH